MSATTVRAIGLACVCLYAAAIARVYVRQPSSLPEVTGSLTSSVGAYRIDQARFDAGLTFFHQSQFIEARDALGQADPARQDPRVQFYVAYSYMRQGWGRVYCDGALYRAGKATLEQARSVATGGTLRVDDPDLKLHSVEELAAEFDRGLTRQISALGPGHLLRERP